MGHAGFAVLVGELALTSTLVHVALAAALGAWTPALGRPLLRECSAGFRCVRRGVAQPGAPGVVRSHVS